LSKFPPLGKPKTHASETLFTFINREKIIKVAYENRYLVET